MPKDQSAAPPPPASADGVPLKRNQACLTCRRRKIRCDAEKPACSTCLRSWRHKVQHLPAGREPPPPPVCDYTDPDELEQPAKKQRPAGAATAAGAAGGKKKGGQKELELEGRIQMLEDMLKLAVGAGVGNVVSGGGQQQMPLQQPPPSQQQQPQQSAGVLPGNVLHALQQPQQPFAVPPAFPSSAGGPADFFDLLPQTTTTAAADATATAAQAQIWSYESPSSGDMSLASGASVASGSSRSVPSLSAQPLSSANPSPGSGGAFSGGGEGLSNPTVDSMDSPDEYLTELLWPGWPPHLPHPGLMDHLATVFLNSIPIVHGLLDPGRFLARLSLPPTHNRFPHPAVLHAMAAVASRYTAVVQVTPPGQFRPQFPRTAAQRLQEPTAPTSDGLGQLADGDEDFGEIHARWARMYFESSLHYPNEWLSLVFAAALLAIYFHSSGLLVETWSWVGQASRLAMPLGLNTGGLVGKGPTLVTPPEDEIDRDQRINLFWLVFTMDAFAAAGSGWAGSISLSDISTTLPVGPPGSPNDGAQQLFSPDMLTSHPFVHANGPGLRTKAIVVLRKATEFVRSADVQKMGDLRQHPAFVELDREIMLFGESFPASCRDPLKATDDYTGRSVDPELHLAHCLWPAALLVLHGNQFDARNANDHSTRQVRLACNVILDRIFRLSATSLDPALLNPMITLSYFLAAKSLLRMISAALEVDDVLTVARLKAEVDVFKIALEHIGQKLPIGMRFSNMINGIMSSLETSFHPGDGKGSCMSGSASGSCAQYRFSMAGGLESKADRRPESQSARTMPAADCMGQST